MILSYFDPINDIRDLRQLINATKNSEISTIAWMADAILHDSRKRLLEKANITHNRATKFSVASLAEVFVGKQYVCELEPTDGDNWAFKKSQLPGTPKVSSQISPIFTLYKLNRLNVEVGAFNPSEKMSREDDLANKFNKTGKYSKQAALRRTYEREHGDNVDEDASLVWKYNAIHGYGGVCTRIWWG